MLVQGLLNVSKDGVVKLLTDEAEGSREDNNNINYNNPNPFLTVDIATTGSPTTTTDKDHTRTTRQLSYLCLIKLHHITTAFIHLLRTITRRIINSSSSSN
ncbi:hypothetical protein ACFE04_000863 [Oxalis oulophora]